MFTKLFVWSKMTMHAYSITNCGAAVTAD